MLKIKRHRNEKYLLLELQGVMFHILNIKRTGNRLKYRLSPVDQPNVQTNYMVTL